MRLRSDAEHGDGSDHGLFLPEQDSPYHRNAVYSRRVGDSVSIPADMNNPLPDNLYPCIQSNHAIKRSLRRKVLGIEQGLLPNWVFAMKAEKLVACVSQQPQILDSMSGEKGLPVVLLSKVCSAAA